MIKQGFIFALLSALCWGFAPILAKLGLAKTPPIIGVSIRSFFIAVCLLIFLIVSGMAREYKGLDARTIMILSAEGLLAGLIGHYFYFKAMKLWDASRATAVIASYPLFAFILAVILLGEKVTLAKAGGAFLVVLGVLLLGL